MDIDNKLDLLKKIRKMDAPPFLFTRIKQQVNNLSSIEASIKWKWAFALGLLFILTCNLSVIFKSNIFIESKHASVKNLINDMNLSSKFDLYNE
jgi:hypothetical protein